MAPTEEQTPYSNYEQKILKFNRDNDVLKLERMFDSSSVLSIVGVERKEIRHSRFLSWLFNQSEINTSGSTSPIMHLLDVIIKRGIEQNKNPLSDNKYRNGIICRSVRIKNVKAELEVSTKGVKLENKTGRIDILISADVSFNGKDEKLAICIENKTYTKEHDDQTWKYYAYLKGKEGDALKILVKDDVFDDNNYNKPDFDKVVFVFLKPYANAEMHKTEEIKNNCKCPCYVHINYQDIVEYVLEPILDNERTSEAISCHIKQYVDSLGLQDKNIKEEKNNIGIQMKDVDKGAMAYKKPIVDLSMIIWDRYKELLQPALNTDKKPILSDFCNAHKVFLANLTSVIEMTTEDDDLWFNTQYYRKRLSDRNNYYIIEVDGKKQICNQTELAVAFAKKYIEIHPSNEIEVLNDSFKDIKGSNVDKPHKPLFNNENKLKDNKSKTPLYEEIKEGIYFEKDCWNSSSEKDGYFNKLKDFIKTQKDIDFKVLC